MLEFSLAEPDWGFERRADEATTTDMLTQKEDPLFRPVCFAFIEYGVATAPRLSSPGSGR